MYDACIYDAANFVTNEQGDSRSRINRISFDEDEDGGGDADKLMIELKHLLWGELS